MYLASNNVFSDISDVNEIFAMIYLSRYKKRNKNPLNDCRDKQGVLKMSWNIRKLEIPETISNNIFLCKNFHYGFVNELLTKTVANHEARSHDSNVGANEHKQVQAIDVEENVIKYYSFFFLFRDIIRYNFLPIKKYLYPYSYIISHIVLVRTRAHTVRISKNDFEILLQKVLK